MQPHDDVKRLLPRVEAVEWLYDGLNGRIIEWTLENGGKSHDPSCQAFLVGRDKSVVSRCPDAKAHSASGFAGWLEEELRTYERKHPRTRVPLLPAEVRKRGDGTPVCAALTEAREAGKPVLLYAGRYETPEDDRAAEKQVRAARRFERSTLGSKSAAEAAEGWVLLRLDLSDEDHAAFARTLGIEKAPALLLFPAGEKEPRVLDVRRIRGRNLAYHLKKHAPE